MSKRTAVGIDLGTTYSCVAAWFDKHNRVEIIPNEQGNKITPSCVAWDGAELLVGEAAKNQISRNPINTAFETIVSIVHAHACAKYKLINGQNSCIQ
ncbi:heat shock protein 70 family, peptide-binding domain protein [Artemisia annua]|uniref:Heat shock protein 70 family, peptide-binding domain protein n=1 Tax=Artemisia annua TaxID=35608 RepID=A0A2U1M9B7_ARTAN|nr:heat shock protein 70 family, peptide-binding domain protein [Artemisia annua]